MGTKKVSEKKDKKVKKVPKKVAEEEAPVVVKKSPRKIIKKTFSPKQSPAAAPLSGHKRKASQEHLEDMEQQAMKKARKELVQKLEENGNFSSGDSDSDSDSVEAAGEVEQPTDDPMHVNNFPMCDDTKKALAARGIHKLFPIQAATFENIVNGQDIVGKARTGSGKTLAFGLPIIEKLLKHKSAEWGRYPRVLGLAPTRELANQVGNELVSVAPSLEVLCVYGGSPIGQQIRKLRDGVDIIFGTPGRVQDLINRECLNLSKVEHVVLDEADEMLNMGFKEETDEILSNVTSVHQTCLFSATVPAWITELANKYMTNHKVIDMVTDGQGTASTDVRHIAIMTHWTSRTACISDCIGMYAGANGRTIVFCGTKSECNDMCSDTNLMYEAKPLHGDIAQASREATLDAFKKGKFRVLVATDVAARGLDMIVDLVINATPPESRSGYAEVETYVHRSGRTGRAGRKGICVTLYQPKAKRILQQIERAVQNNFDWLGAPQPEDVMKIAANTAVTDAMAVPATIVTTFEESAKDMLAQCKNEPVIAVARALAMATGHTKPPPSRSLLTNATGYTCYMFKSHKWEIDSPGYAWGAIRRVVPEEVAYDKAAICSMQLTKDRWAAVFDIRNDTEHYFEEELKKDDWLFKVTELPELQEVDFGGKKGGKKGGKGGGGKGGGKGGKGGKKGGKSRGGGIW